MAVVKKEKIVNFGSVIIKLKIEKGTQTSDRYFDGYNMGKETRKIDRFLLDFNGKRTSEVKPTKILEEDGIRAEQKKAGSYYACATNGIGFKKESGDVILKAIQELEKEVELEIDEQTKKELKEIENVELEKETKRNEYLKQEKDIKEKNIKSGLCPKCGTWCYGDCESN
jgi:hypothetical protein